MTTPTPYYGDVRQRSLELFPTVELLNAASIIMEEYYHFALESYDGTEDPARDINCPLEPEEVEWISDGYNFIWTFLETDLQHKENSYWKDSTVDYFIKMWLQIPENLRTVGIINELI